MAAEVDPLAWASSQSIDGQAPVASFVESLKEDHESRSETLRSVRSVVQQLSRQVQDYARIPIDETSFDMLRGCQQEMLGVCDSILQKVVPEVTDSVEEMNQFFSGSVQSEVADALRQCLVAQEERSQALLQSLEHLSTDMHVACAEEASSELGESVEDIDDPYFNERQARAARRRSLEDLIQKEKNRTHQLHGFVLRHMKQLIKDQFHQINANIDEIRMDAELQRNELIRNISSRNSEEEKRLRWELEEERQRTLLVLGQSSGNLELVKEVEGIRDTIVNVTEMVANSDKSSFEEMQPAILSKLKSVMKQVSSNLDHMRRASITSPGGDNKEVLDMQVPAVESDEGDRVVSTRSADAAAGVEVISAPPAARRTGSPARRTGGQRSNGSTGAGYGTGDSLAGTSDGTWAEDAPVRPRRSGSASSTGHGRAAAPLPGSKRLASSSPRASAGGGRGQAKSERRDRTPGPSKALQRNDSRREVEYGGSAKLSVGGSNRGSGTSLGGGSSKNSVASNSTAMSPGRSGSSAHGSARNAREERKGATSRDSSPAAPKRAARDSNQPSPKRGNAHKDNDLARGTRSPGREASPKRRSEELRHTPPQTTYQPPPLNPQVASSQSAKSATTPDSTPHAEAIPEFPSASQQTESGLAVGAVTVIPPAAVATGVVASSSSSGPIAAARLLAPPVREPRVMPPSAIAVVPLPGEARGAAESRQDPRLLVRPAVTPLSTMPDSLRSPAAAWRHSSPPAANGAAPTRAAAVTGAGRSSPGRPAVGLSSSTPMRGPPRASQSQSQSQEDNNSDADSLHSTQPYRGAGTSPTGLEAVSESSGSISTSFPLGTPPAPASRPLSVEGRREVSRVASAPRMPIVMMAQGNLVTLQPPGRPSSLTVQEALRLKNMVSTAGSNQMVSDLTPIRQDGGLQQAAVSMERPLSNTQRQ